MLLLGFLLLHLALLSFVLCQENIKLVACLVQLIQFHGHLLALLLHSLALRPLVCGVLLHEAQAAVHLVEILCAEHKAELALCIAVAVHIPHGTDVVLAALLQFVFQNGEL